MRREEALQILGLGAADVRDRALLRAAYLRRMRAVHPDLNPSADATVASATVSAAYRLLTEGQRPVRAAAQARAAAQRTNGNGGGHLKARVLNESTLSVEGGRDLVFAAVVEASQRLGEVSHVDEDSGMVSVVVEFLHAPPCSILLTQRPRADQRVHVSCAVDTLSGAEPPPLGAVTRLVTDTLCQLELAQLQH